MLQFILIKKEYTHLTYTIDLVAKFGSSLDVEEINLLSVDLLKSLDDFAKTDQMKDDKLLSKLQRSGVALWNFVIAKRTAKKASHIACARGM